MLGKFREIVKTHYNFNHGGELRNTITALMRNDDFCCEEGNTKVSPRSIYGLNILIAQVGGGRFLASIIVKVISSLFFSRDHGSFGSAKLTQHMFNPFTGTLIALVCTMIFHSIKEFENTGRVTIKFEGAEHVDGKFHSIDCNFKFSLIYINSTLRENQRHVG